MTRVPAHHDRRGAIVHRHVVQVVVLGAVAVGAFLGTRIAARHLEAERRADAEQWFIRGQQAFSSGKLDEAIGDFRRASLTRPDHEPYVLRLADALTRGGQAQVAQRAHARNALAAAELVAMSDELPDTVAAHVEVGDLFAAAHDVPAALGEYLRALQRDPRNEAARVGAGRAAFQLKNYQTARQYLLGAGSRADERLGEVADLVLTLDPLAAAGADAGAAARKDSAGCFRPAARL